MTRGETAAGATAVPLAICHGFNRPAAHEKTPPGSVDPGGVHLLTLPAFSLVLPTAFGSPRHQRRMRCFVVRRGLQGFGQGDHCLSDAPDESLGPFVHALDSLIPPRSAGGWYNPTRLPPSLPSILTG